MQNKYVGDIGDFGKSCLLRTLQGGDLQLAIVWYLNVNDEQNSDGNLTKYPLNENLKFTDPLQQELRGKLQTLINNGERTVQAVRKSEIFPQNTVFQNTVFIEEPVPSKDCVLKLREEKRDEWCRRSSEQVEKSDSDLVFLDPDNGLACTTTSNRRITGAKYVFPDELEAFCQHGKSVILYQRPHLSAKHEDQINDHLREVKTITGRECYCTRFRRQQARFYFIFPANTGANKMLRSRLDKFLDGSWGSDSWFDTTLYE